MFRIYKAKVRFLSGRYSFFEAWYWKFGKHWHRTHSLSTSQEAQNDVSEFIMPQTLARSPGKSISLGFFGISNGPSLRHIFLCKLLGNYMRAKLHLLFFGKMAIWLGDSSSKSSEVIRQESLGCLKQEKISIWTMTQCMESEPAIFCRPLYAIFGLL